MELGFATLLWAAIFCIEILLLVARTFFLPGPARLSLSLSIPALLLLGAAVNAIYNWATTGNIFETPPPRRRIPRH